LAITIKEFQDVLADEGIVPIESKVGDDFDEELHEAVEMQDVKMKDKELKGVIDEILLRGWQVKDGPVIRYTKVKVK
jgi:molecular chaperone GrpE (heat shock protein)